VISAVVPDPISAYNMQVWQIRQPGQDTQMTRRTNDFRFTTIALTAIAGILSFGHDATARTVAGSGRKAAKSCCSSGVCPMGCCSPRAATNVADSGGRLPAVSLRTTGLTRPPSSCECQSDEPAAPASRPESGAPGGRHAEELSEVAFLPISPTNTGLVTYLIERGPWPPGSPIYLATSRLLI
jgi:hypothetical protein